MALSLTDYRAGLQDRLLEILWRQWSALGVAGQNSTWQGSVIDPEALLLFSSTLTRYDARLFDAIVEWLQLNGRYINVQRLKRMLIDEQFSGANVLAAMAATVRTSATGLKWEGLTRVAPENTESSEPLFFLKDGRPLPLARTADKVFEDYGLLRDRFQPRSAARHFRPEPMSNLLLRLRALLGVNARCEIMLYLLTNEFGSPRAMARDCYHYPATTSKALAEMGASGFLISRVDGRHRYYRLAPETWRMIFFEGAPPPTWLVWARLFSAFEQILIFLGQEDLDQQSPLAQASALRRLLRRSLIRQFDHSGLPMMFGDDSAYPGQALIPFFIERIEAFLEAVETKGL